MQLSIIIPTVGRKEILNKSLKQLFKAIDGFNIEVILIDDSKNGSVECKEKENIRVFRSAGQGASYARNMGWQNARSHLLLFLDDDILIEKRHIERTLALHVQPSKTAYNFFWVYPPDLMQRLDGSKFGKYLKEKGLYSNAHRLGYKPDEMPDMIRESGLSSQYFSIEKRWIETVGGYDPIPFAGVEDLILYKKLSKIGVEVFLSKNDVVYQNEENRLELESVLKRYRRGAFTRRIAVEQGHPEFGVNFTKDQIKAGKLLSAFKFLFMAASKLTPYSYTYRKLVNTLLFISTYQGFYTDPLPAEYA